MIVTVSPNPSLDRTVSVADLKRGSILRVDPAAREPSGKGVNVSLALSARNRPTRAILPIGGPDGLALAVLLHATGLDWVGVPIADDVRSNISIVEPDGTVTKVNEPGPHLTATETTSLLEATIEATVDATLDNELCWIACCGSLPRGVPDDFYASIADRAHPSGVRIAVDSSGAALRSAITRQPELIKPNLDELVELAGRPLPRLGDVVTAAEELVTETSGAVLVTLGGDGAVYVDAETAVHGEAPVPVFRNPVGAGDAMLAGFLGSWTDSANVRDALIDGLASAAAACARAGTEPPGENDLRPDDVVLHSRIDSDRPLQG